MTHPDATFTVDHNIFSDRTPEEMAMKLNKNNVKSFKNFENTAGKAIPRAIPTGFGDKNWCEQFCNEIQDQGDCGGGWAFA